MERHYKREMGRNYLIIKPSEQGGGYACDMLLKNRIQGLLKFSKKYIDGVEFYYYEITSRQPLARILEQRNITKKEICRLILEISVTLERIERYLLCEQHILLDPEYIYVEPEQFVVSLCFVPGQEGDFSKNLSELLRYFLGRVDHQEKECVILAYRLYQESLKENYGIWDLQALLQSPQEGSEEPAKPSYLQESAEDKEPEPSPAIFVKETRQPSFKWLCLIGVALPIVVSIFFGVRGLWRYKIWVLIAELVLVFLFMWHKLARQVDLSLNTKEQGEKSEELTLVTQRQWEIDVSTLQETSLGEEVSFPEKEECNTVLLTDLSNQAKVRCLVSQTKEFDNIPISYYPFLIGKQEGVVDYLFCNEAVSRLHARIDLKEDRYYITDLNSTNGTYVDGNLLETNETRILNVGSQVTFADLSFIFT